MPTIIANNRKIKRAGILHKEMQSSKAVLQLLDELGVFKILA